MENLVFYFIWDYFEVSWGIGAPFWCILDASGSVWEAEWGHLASLWVTLGTFGHHFGTLRRNFEPQAVKGEPQGAHGCPKGGPRCPKGEFSTSFGSLFEAFCDNIRSSAI